MKPGQGRTAVQALVTLAFSFVLAGCGSTPITGCNGALCRQIQTEFLYAYSYSNSSILAFPVDPATGTLGMLTSMAGPASSEGVVATPGGEYLYVSDAQTDAIEAFSINAANGSLTPITGSPFSVNASPPLAASGLAIDPTGKFLYVMEFSAGTVAGFSINNSTGALTAVTGSPFPAGNGPVLGAVDPSGKFLYVSNLYDANGGISAYSIDSSNGALTPVPGSPIPTIPNGSPQFLVAKGKFLYVVLDDANAGPGHIAAFSIDTTGALTPVSNSPFTAGNSPLGVAVDGAGKHLFVTNNGDGTISVFDIDPNTGALSPVVGSPFSAGMNQHGLPRCPYSLVVDPDAKFLYVGDGCNPDLLTFAIGVNGALTGPSVTTATGAPLYLALTSVP